MPSRLKFLSSLRGRIQSIARTQNLLDQTHSRSISLADLVRTELRPYATATNTDIDGPAVYLVPAATHALAMVLHELATNAAKYGALSQTAGHLSVRWGRPANPSSAPMLESNGGRPEALTLPPLLEKAMAAT